MAQRTLYEMLLEILRPGTQSLLHDNNPLSGASEWGQLIQLAEFQSVETLLYQRLLDRKMFDVVPGSYKNLLKNSFRRHTLRNMFLQNELKQISRAMQAANIPVIVLKGAYLAKAVYPSLGTRILGDIDLLVKPGDLQRAAEIVLDLGFELDQTLSYDWAQIMKHLPSFSKNNMPDLLEIHWTVVESGEEWDFLIEAFWEDAVSAGIDDGGLLALSPENLLLHLCFHAAFSHNFEFSLRPYCDIQLVVVRFKEVMNWDEVIGRARRWGWDRGVYMSLRFVDEMLGGEIPSHVLKQLGQTPDVERMYGLVRSQIESYSGGESKVNNAVARFAGLSLKNRGKLLLEIFFPSRMQLGLKYKVTPSSPMILLMYFRRWFDLIRGHSKTVINLSDSENEVTISANRKSEIHSWLRRR